MQFPLEFRTYPRLQSHPLWQTSGQIRGKRDWKLSQVSGQVDLQILNTSFFPQKSAKATPINVKKNSDKPSLRLLDS